MGDGLQVLQVALKHMVLDGWVEEVVDGQVYIYGLPGPRDDVRSATPSATLHTFTLAKRIPMPSTYPLVVGDL